MFLEMVGSERKRFLIRIHTVGTKTPLRNSLKYNMKQSNLFSAYKLFSSIFLLSLDIFVFFVQDVSRQSNVYPMTEPTRILRIHFTVYE